MTTPAPLDLRRLGRRAYPATLEAMRHFTDAREPETRDEIWCVEHDPVFTLGQAGRREHLIEPDDTPVVATDRGGQITWHGPGQCVVYPLLELRRYGLGARSLVTLLEESIVEALRGAGIAGAPRADAPGVYVDGAKIAAVGLRIRRGRCYHGMALNVCNDLAPFSRIHPCGYAGLETTSVHALGHPASFGAMEERLLAALLRALQKRYASVSSR